MRLKNGTRRTFQWIITSSLSKLTKLKNMPSVRMWCDYMHYTPSGGIYLDSDVEAFKPLDAFLKEPAFTGFEQVGYPVCATMGAEKGNPIIKEMLDYYDDKEFKVQEDWTKYTTNTVIMSDILSSHGIDRYKNEIQRIKDFTVYPKEYFMNKEGYTFHHMAGSWGS